MAELAIASRITAASNGVYRLTDGRVYKPIAEEEPLWDFPDGSLAAREYATYLVTRAAGWEFVPETAIVTEAPLGPGTVQQWIAGQTEEAGVTTRLQSNWLPVAQGQDQAGETIVLGHADTEQLRSIALADWITNNTDRKGRHLLTDAEGKVWGIDHGTTFSEELKVRTVLWGFVGREFTDTERSFLTTLRGREASLSTPLADLLTAIEVAAMWRRLDMLLSLGEFPALQPGWPALPYPPI